MTLIFRITFDMPSCSTGLKTSDEIIGLDRITRDFPIESLEEILPKIQIVPNTKLNGFKYYSIDVDPEEIPSSNTWMRVFSKANLELVYNVPLQNYIELVLEDRDSFTYL